MAKYLVIVESPAKVKTIKKFLGPNYEVMASNGHVRDLPKSQLGFDVENDYEPKYITIRGKGDILAALRKAAKKADKVYLATDPDREGEAISWHLSYALKLDKKKMRRITFNEITKSAVKASIKEARDINMNLVDAQQARRVLDRMVGQESPGPYGRIRDQSTSLGKSKAGLKRRPCAVCSTSYHWRPGGRNQPFYSGRILDPGWRVQHRRGEKTPYCQVLRKQKQEDHHTLQRGTG